MLSSPDSPDLSRRIVCGMRCTERGDRFVDNSCFEAAELDQRGRQSSAKPLIWMKKKRSASFEANQHPQRNIHTACENFRCCRLRGRVRTAF